jgi:flagellar motor switch protein FliN/FliY
MSATEPNTDAVDEAADAPEQVDQQEASEQDVPDASDAAAAEPGVTPVELSELESVERPNEVGNLELLRGIELTVTVEVGRARMRVKDLLGLHEGSVVELDRPVGSPVDLLANGRTIARGEIVLVEDQLGIRVTGFSSDGDSG